MDQRDTIRKEVLENLKEGEKDGSIQEMEYRMIRNVFSFRDKDAKEVMTHRKNIVALNCNDILEEVAALHPANIPDFYPMKRNRQYTWHHSYPGYYEALSES